VHTLPDHFQTRRLRLRAPTPADADTLFRAYAQDAEVCRFMAWAPHASVAVTRAFIAESIELWSAGRTLRYILAEPGSNAALGMLEARLGDSTVGLGYVLARSRWGSGLMPEAIGVLVAACLAQPGIFRVEAICDAENHASARALEKSGFVREGRLERYGIHPNISPEPRAVFMYARVR
jgi:[ribosomal protein S5]-alanine N-acetyltransferase